MKNIFRYLLVAGTILLMVQCASNETANSDTVKQSEIYQSYSVTYNSGEKELTAFASFRFGGQNGTTLFLVNPSKVLFDGEEMPSEQNILSGTFYQISRQEEFKPSYTFVFTDCDGKSYSNTCRIIPAEISRCPQTADNQQGFTVEWTTPLQDGESITLFVEDKNNHTCSVYNNVVGSTSIKINPTELKNIQTGEINVYLVREKISSLENATYLGGRMTAKYISKKQGLNLTGSTPAEEEKKDTVQG